MQLDDDAQIETPKARSDEAVAADVRSLWLSVFGEPPVIEAPTRVLLDLLVSSFPAARFAAATVDGERPTAEMLHYVRK